MTTIGPWQQRVAVFLVSAVIIFVEITLMRELALRFWEHLAWLVISIALLGFGASGTALVLMQRFCTADKPSLQFVSLMGMALSFPLCLLLGDSIDLDLIQMVWQPSHFWKLGALELVLGIPFLFGGMFVGLALQDRPDRVPGHYAASFLGSGAGGMIVLPALFVSTPRFLILCGALVVFAAALFYVRGKVRTGGWIFSGLLLALMVSQFPHLSKISDDKDLPQILAMPGTEILARRYGPQGLIEIVEAPAVHTAPGLALSTIEPVPDQLLITLDAQIVGSLYKIASHDDFAFLDNTTQALPYQLGPLPHVLIGDDTGTDHVGLALLHGVAKLTALTVNSSLAHLKSSEMSSYSGHIYNTPGVSVFTATPRSYLRKSRGRYSLITLPTTGTDPGGLTAATTDSLFTLETFRLCFAHLEEKGVLSVSTHVHSPPRESLRLLNMFIDVIKESGREPYRHIAMIRNWATVTLVATKSALTDRQTADIRAFCQQRGFDLVWLPDLNPLEVNRYHVLDEADYFLGARALLEPQNNQFASRYFYDISSPDDNKPFFHHFSRWQRSKDLAEQVGRRGRAYMELGGVLLIGALCQSLLLAFTFILLPLVPAIGLPGDKSEKFAVIGFFSSIGFGFMLLEMGLLQRLTLYFAHPVYAAATVLSGFLFFGGLGSTISSRLQEPLSRLHCGLGIGVVATGSLTMLALDRILTTTEWIGLPGLMTLSLLLIGPLGSLMGMMFPLGIKRVGRGPAQLIPWAWSANGFTSVLGTLCAPFLAMQWGFNVVTWTALGCYCLAAILSLKLPR